jgi:hypothetical protein
MLWPLPVKNRGLLVTTLALAAGVAIYALKFGGNAPPPPAAGLPTQPSQADRVAAVEKVVTERNRNLGEEARRFEADGWQMVAADAPDPRLTEMDPALIPEGRERELRVQIASTTAAARNARNLGRILLTAELPETREAATDALGRIKGDAGKIELIEVLTSGKLHADDLGRRQIAAHLRPSDLDAELAPRIANLLDSTAVTAAEKEQIAYNLALVGLRDGMTLSENVLATLSPEARALIDRMTTVGGTAFLAHTHKH